MVQRLMQAIKKPQAQWVRITNRMDTRPSCAIVGCVLYASVTDGERCLCSQHLTEHAMQHDTVLRARHDIPSHVAGGVCVFCGHCDWGLRPQVCIYQCNVCYPLVGEGYQRNIIDASQFLANSKSLPAQSNQFTPISEVERAKTRKTFAYLFER